MSILNRQGINLRQEMLDLLSKTQYSVLLQKTSKKIRCKCYNETFQEANSRCKICLGTGWIFKFEKHKTFKQDFGSSPEVAVLFTEVGQITNGYKFFYFAHDIHPQNNDYIWEVTWKRTKPVALSSLYKIKEVSEQRGETGKIEYYVVLAQKEVIDKNFKNMHIGKAWRDV